MRSNPTKNALLSQQQQQQHCPLPLKSLFEHQVVSTTTLQQSKHPRIDASATITMSQSAVAHNAIAVAASLTSHEQPAVTCTSDEEGGTRNTASPPSLSLPSVPREERSPTKKRACEYSKSSTPSNKKAKESAAAAAVAITASGNTSHVSDESSLSHETGDAVNNFGLLEKSAEPIEYIIEAHNNNILSRIIAEEEKEGADAGEMSDEKKSDKKQIEYIDEPRINDCLMTGESLTADPKSATRRYEDMILEKRSLFHKSDKEGRSLIAAEIVQEWQALDPPGRFLRQDKGNGKWYIPSVQGAEKVVTSRWLEKMTMRGLHLGDRTENDMFIGKKFMHLHRSGNKKYQELLASKKMLYREASRNDKASIAIEIVQEWRGQNPPGRFLEEWVYDYCDIGDGAAKKKIMLELGKGSRKKKQRDSNDSNGTAVSVSEDGAEVIQKIKSKQSGNGKENISPYQTDSSYNDVLSFFASTPFDADVQTTLHVQKELSFQRSSLILPSRATLHIVPQKQFIKGKAPASGANGENGDDATLVTAPDKVDREASKFLLEEAEYLLKKRESTKARPVSSPKMPQNGQCPISEVCNGARNGSSAIATLREAQANVPNTAPTIAMAITQINSASVNVEQTAKLPVAFGFYLDDGGTSKHLAQAATDKWQSHGEKSAKKSNKGLRVSIGSVKKGSTGLPVCHTPKVAKTPSSATPKTPKTPALLLSTEAARKLPDGWVSKTYKRMAGKTAGTKDIYFYSPQKQIKFRAMKSCKTFIDIMGELEVDGDEAAALKLYKERGHRF